MADDYSSSDNDDSSSSSSSSSHSTRSSHNHATETIALFGIHGATGAHFVKLALDAGYAVQALAPTASVVALQHPSLHIIEGTLDDSTKLQQVVQGATYVVCMLGETFAGTKKEYVPGTLVDFCSTLYPFMKESPTRLFLYQVCECLVLYYYV